jgi:hypothetical protein
VLSSVAFDNYSMVWPNEIQLDSRVTGRAANIDQWLWEARRSKPAMETILALAAGAGRSGTDQCDCGPHDMEATWSTEITDEFLELIDVEVPSKAQFAKDGGDLVFGQRRSQERGGPGCRHRRNAVDVAQRLVRQTRSITVKDHAIWPRSLANGSGRDMDGAIPAIPGPEPGDRRVVAEDRPFVTRQYCGMQSRLEWWCRCDVRQQQDVAMPSRQRPFGQPPMDGVSRDTLFVQRTGAYRTRCRRGRDPDSCVDVAHREMLSSEP